jgi:hypothetical protein
MKRREFIAAFGSAVAWPLAARAQQADGRAAALLLRILQLRADGAADRIGQIIGEVIGQIGWTVQLSWSEGTMEQRRFDGLRLLRQVIPVTELAQLDPTGKRRLRVSRLVIDLGEGETDFSQDPKFTEAVRSKVYYGPVYLRRQSEAYMTLSVAGTRPEYGVSVAEVNLSLFDMVRQIRIGEHGVAYILDAQGRVIVHPEMLGLDTAGRQIAGDLKGFQRDFSGLAQVQAARAAGSGPTQARAARDINGRDVLSASARVAGPGWHVFVELPLAEADTAVP